MTDQIEDSWIPDWKSRVRSWLDELLIFALILATLIVVHYGLRLFRPVDTNLFEFMESTHRLAVKLIWVLFLVAQVRKAIPEALSFERKKKAPKKKNKSS